MSQKSYSNGQLSYKLIMIGDVNVGKTTLLWQYVQSAFLANKQRLVTMVDFKMKKIDIRGKQIKLCIWDTAGSQKYRSIITTYFNGAHGVVIVFDLTRQQTFLNVKNQWYPLALAKTNNTCIIVVGNKSDLNGRMERDQPQKWCNQKNILYIQTSVKLNKNVNQTFQNLAYKIYQKKVMITRPMSIQLSQQKQQNNKKICCKI